VAKSPVRNSPTVRILGPEEFARVRQAINQKYWLARLPFLWRNTDTYIEITPTGTGTLESVP